MAFQLTEQAKYYLEQLETLAAQDDMSLEDLLVRVFEQYTRLVSAPQADAPPVGTPGYKLVEAVKKVDLKGGGPDTSGRTRQILEDEYGDYLQDRLSRDAD